MFYGKTIKPNTEISLKVLAYNSDKISKATAFAFRKYNNILPLYEKGGVIVEIGEKEYALVYKGEKLIQGTSNDKKILEFYRKVKEKISKNSKDLEDALDETSQTIKYENGRIGYVEGLYDSIKVSYKPRGFESLKDIEDFDPKYGRGIETRFEDYEGYFYRNFDAKKKIFTFNHGFLQNLPKWVEDVKVPLVQGKGIPTQAYFTLRQMKLLNITEGEMQLVKMSQIQNLETMGYIHEVTGGKIIRNFDSVDILAAPSNEYMTTIITQAGYENISGRIIGQGQYFSIKQLKARQWDISDEFMKKYDLSESSMLYMNFNIEVKVKYIKK
ncbi:hypothetical protein [uncultured Chryseobacterium sp.]|uniref:hypothetical protein n=1 Tax=uncultured Chryseobacterium sp. TaxID=259322 RepID=UPI0025D6955F|nr:hypothetical protein [uncultured Chryseobacterium sp.]